MVKAKKTVKKVKNTVEFIKKRDGSLVTFDTENIAKAVWKAMKASGEGTEKDALIVAKSVHIELDKKCANDQDDCTPTVEEIQDLVEKQLILHQFVATSKSYILYREKRTELRLVRGEVPAKVKELANESKKYFQNELSEFVYYRSYSRWIEEENRRETWTESVDRYLSFMKENLAGKLKEEEYKELRESMLAQKVMPSMRLMWGAGKAARKTNAVCYNCSFIAPTTVQDLAEIIYLSMCGCGVGFSVESLTAQQFPIVKKQSGKMDKTVVVDDSKE